MGKVNPNTAKQVAELINEGSTTEPTTETEVEAVAETEVEKQVEEEG